MDFELQRHPMGHLVLRLGGTEHTGVVPVLAFPLSAPGEGLSLVSTEGRELLWIDRLDALPGAQRALLDEELVAREFHPEVRRLLSVSTFSTPSIWRVETDRGTTDFVLKSEEDIRRLPDGGLLIASGQGVHFRVRDRAALDRPSRRLLERFL
ncbi:DUF1854 domain-containing protein [Pseudorhodoferax sp. Leaf274]|uniref:cyanophycin metabolism-associated DUF1854 family protein n=1 Tax=Pseudorhodoferax sp. Leaf274 TaxID=1736318 RepID=UPI000703098D|nr:DUF1854 domain-containing protein [Pseudorhodoferax sp. Leaf274]KQP48604.1 hypothetical protein ASF44_22130 [Pseudorhodoferax sp. Leaf274]